MEPATQTPLKKALRMYYTTLSICCEIYLQQAENTNENFFHSSKYESK